MTEINRPYHSVANIFPLLHGDEYESLKTDIASNGLLEAIWLHPDDESIIDGRNRHRACCDLNITPKFRYWDRKGSLVSFVVSLNLKRRHLTPSQAAMVGVEILPMLEAEAKERQREALTRGNKTRHENDLPIVANLPQSADEPAPKARDQAAAIVGVSARTIQDAKTVKEQGVPDLVDAVRSGKVAVSTAADIAQAPAEEQSLIVARTEKEILDAAKKIRDAKQAGKKELIEQKKQEAMAIESASIEESPNVYLADAIEFLSGYDDDHFDLLFTDPPYATDVDDIAAFAAEWVPLALAKVKKSGRAYICTGAYPQEMKAYLDVFTAQDKFIVDCPLVWTYRNTLGVTPKMKYNLNYQLVWHLYSNDSRELDTTITNEMFSVQDINAPDGRQFNRFHTWQKPNELARRLINHSTQPGDLIVDPFTCTGTFVLMSVKMGRQAVGADISADNLEIAKERGCNVIR